MMMYHAGARVCIENEDGVRMNATIEHTYTIREEVEPEYDDDFGFSYNVHWALIRYETGLTVPMMFVELDKKVVYDW